MTSRFASPSVSRRRLLAGLALSPLAGLAPLALGGRAVAAPPPAAPTGEMVFADADVPVLGNARGDVAVAMWFDYRCPYCRKVEPVLNRVAAEDGRVAILLKDWPIFGPVSDTAARLAWSARRQGKGEAVHAAFMKGEARPTADRLENLLAGLGLDRARLDRDVATDRPAFDALVARNAAQAEAFGFPGTPAFVIGTFVFPGVIDEAGFRQAIADARRKG